MNRVISPNQNERPEPKEISLIVVHCISLPPGEFDPEPVCELFTNRLDCGAHPYFAQLEGLKVSSHLYIDRAGELTQFVALDQRAWHAGQSQYAGRQACNDFSIGIELAGMDSQHYTDAQYMSLIGLIHTLQSHYPATKQHPVVGHSHIAPGRKTDPGPAFEWHRLQQAGIAVLSESKID